MGTDRGSRAKSASSRASGSGGSSTRRSASNVSIGEDLAESPETRRGRDVGVGDEVDAPDRDSSAARNDQRVGGRNPRGKTQSLAQWEDEGGSPSGDPVDDLRPRRGAENPRMSPDGET